MKWVFRIFGLIIGLFLFGCLAGFFISPHISVERSEDMFTVSEDMFPYMEDLETHALWSPWHEPDARHTVGGSNVGVGQEAAWSCQAGECQFGTEKISVSQYPEFVQTDLNIDGRYMQATYAVMDNENADGSLSVLFKVETELGGFPYIQRIFKFREKSRLGDKLEAGLIKLEALLIADGMAD